MLSYDNTVNYGPSFKKIDESIESINTLLTSLLLDTYTNQTFIYSDINVIRVNTSYNYDSIQSLSTSLPYKLDSSVSTNFFTLSNSTQFASTSQLSSKLDVSDSTNFFTLSNSTQFASTSQLSSKLDVSDSTIFALSSELSSKLDISNSTQFALSSELTSKLDISNSTQFALSSELTSKFNVSDSTFFLPSSDYSTVSQAYLVDISNFIETHTTNASSLTEMNLSFSNIIYNMYPTSYSLPANETFILSNQPLLYNLSFTGNLQASSITVRNFSMESGLMIGNQNELMNATFNGNSYLRLQNCSITGTFKNNTFTQLSYYNSISGMVLSNDFEHVNMMDVYLNSHENSESNTWMSVDKLNIYIRNLDYTVAKNGFYSVNTLMISE